MALCGFGVIDFGFGLVEFACELGQLCGLGKVIALGHLIGGDDIIHGGLMMFYLVDVLPVKRAIERMKEVRERAQQKSHTQGCPASEAHTATPKARTATTARTMARRMVTRVRIAIRGLFG